LYAQAFPLPGRSGLDIVGFIGSLVTLGGHSNLWTTSGIGAHFVDNAAIQPSRGILRIALPCLGVLIVNGGPYGRNSQLAHYGRLVR
jgi:hypothetical protein